MKKALTLLAIGLCLVAALYAAADFSGTWALNAEKTTAANPAPAGGGGGGGGGGRGGGGGGGDMTIKMTAAEMSITRTMGGNEMVVAYKLDGKENTVNTGRGDLKYTATWAGNVLTVAGTQAGGRNGDAPYKVQYEMSADGKTLTISTTNQGQNGETVRKQVYDKK